MRARRGTTVIDCRARITATDQRKTDYDLGRRLVCELRRATAVSRAAKEAIAHSLNPSLSLDGRKVSNCQNCNKCGLGVAFFCLAVS